MQQDESSYLGLVNSPGEYKERRRRMLDTYLYLPRSRDSIVEQVRHGKPISRLVERVRLRAPKMLTLSVTMVAKTSRVSIY